MEPIEQKSPTPESVNIFADFTSDKKLVSDVQKMEERKKKTPLYYATLIGNIFKTINVFLFLSVVLFFAYSHAQSSEDIDLSMINSACIVFTGEAPLRDTGCTSVTSYTNYLNAKIEEEKKTQFSKIAGVIGDIYTLENFIYSKEVTFLLSKGKQRVKPLKLLQDFDTLKNQFEPIEKSKIECNNILIQKENTLKIQCEAFSSDWDKQIVGFSGDKSLTSVEGTSVSVANSFINYIQENAKTFALKERQKTFAILPINDDGPYTKKTTFDLDLVYIGDNL